MTSRNIIRLVILAAAVGTSRMRSCITPMAARSPQPPQRFRPTPKNSNSARSTFKTCDLAQKNSGATTSAFCAPFSVPENRDDANSRKIDLRLALIKSDAAAADADIVVFLAGGPGQAAVDTWPQVAGSFAPLRKHHHILLLDQRGTGQSNPLTCKHADDETDTGEEFDAAKAEQRIRTCLDEVSKKADPRFYTTTIAADDLEAVRAALGNPTFDLVGISYGTRMAQQYAMRHPDGVRSIVLDSVAPNEIALGQDFAANLENSLKAEFAACTNTPACQKAFGDPYANLYTLRDQLRANPRDFDYHNPTTFKNDKKRLDQYALTGLVRMFAYTPETAALLPLSISQGLHGDFTPLLGQSELLKGDLADLTDNGMQMSVICSEDADLIKPRPEDDKTLLGNLHDQKPAGDVLGVAARHATGGFPCAVRIRQTRARARRRIRSRHAARVWRTGDEESLERETHHRQRPGPQRDRPRLHSETGRGFRRRPQTERPRREMRRPPRPHAGFHRLQRRRAIRNCHDRDQATAQDIRQGRRGHDVSFLARDGEITGLLGPNGAGKTTTLRCLYTLMKPDSGQILVDGIDAAQRSARRAPPARRAARRARSVQTPHRAREHRILRPSARSG